MSKKNKKEMNATAKEIIITIVVLILAVIVGVWGGKVLYEAFNGPI